jgi:hypothetical protein
MNRQFLVYCQFANNQAECYEFSPELFNKIASGDVTPLYESGVSPRFFRVTVDNGSEFKEVWKRNNRNNHHN